MPPRTVAVVALEPGVPIDEVAQRLTTALGEHGSVARLDSGELATIDQAVEDADRVVLAGGDRPDDAWTDLCVRDAELIVAVSTGSPTPPWLSRADALRDCELIVIGRSLTLDVMAALEPRETQLLRDVARLPDALDATARRLAGRSLGVVLSGGGARALAHLGVLEELSAAGMRFDRVAGVSLGALVAGGVALGLDSEELNRRFHRAFVATKPTNDYTMPVFSVIRGGKARRMLHDEFGDLLAHPRSAGGACWWTAPWWTTTPT